MESTGDNIVVKADRGSPVILMIVIIAFSLIGLWQAFISDNEFMDKIVFTILVTGPFLAVFINNQIDSKRQIAACEDGMTICNRKGKKRKIGYEEISSIQIVPQFKWRIAVGIELEDQEIICFYSSDKNYEILMKVLMEKIPEVFVWNH